MSKIKNNPTYKKGNYSPIPKSRIQKGAKTIIALRGCDWNKIPRKEIRRLHKKIGAVLALDDVALGHAIKHGMDVLILEDFIEHDELIDINKQATELSRSWHTNATEAHTFDNINFAEIDTWALYCFWQELLSAYLCAKKINEKKLHVILVDEDTDNIPWFYWRNEIFCKVCLHVLDSYSTITLKNTIKYNHRVKKYSFSLKSPIDNKPVATLMNFEIKRAQVLLDKLKHIHNDLSIIPSDYTYMPNDFYNYKPANFHNNNDFNGIPVHEVTEVDDNTYVNSFIPAFENIKNNTNFLPEELHPVLYKVLEYYYTKRYPEILSKYYSYKNLFIKHRPLCVFGTDTDYAEASLPLIAANALGIPTIAWGHALIQYYLLYNRSISTFIVHSAQGIRNAIANNIPQDRCLLIKDQGELNILFENYSHLWKDNQDATKILVLPYLSKQYGTSHYVSNYYRQMENIKTLCSPPKYLNVDIKLKEHPAYDTKGMYLFLKINEKKWTFPKNANLSYLIQAADICILLGEIGCALLHASKKIPTLLVTNASLFPYNISNDDQNKKIFIYDHSINDYPNKVDSPEDIWPWIEKVISDESYRKTMMKKQQDFNYIDEKTMTFEQAMKEKLKHLSNQG